jgi:thiol:disulfide interchange protein DsbD
MKLKLNWQVKEGYYLYRQQIKLTAQQADHPATTAFRRAA